MCAHQIKGSNSCFAVKLHGNIFITVKCIIPRSLAPFFAASTQLDKKAPKDGANLRRGWFGERTRDPIPVSLVSPGSACPRWQTPGISRRAALGIPSRMHNSAGIKKKKKSEKPGDLLNYFKRYYFKK